VDSWGQRMLEPLVAYLTLQPFGFIYPFSAAEFTYCECPIHSFRIRRPYSRGPRLRQGCLRHFRSRRSPPEAPP
jgi:hypothetical protein